MKNYKEDLTSMIVEVDYQQRYTYEERCEFFNKWGVSTATKFFNPIMALCSLIEITFLEGCRDEFKKYELCRYGMSHSGAVMSSFNKKFVTDEVEHIKFREFGEKISCVEFFKYQSGGGERTFKKKIIIIIKEDIAIKFLNVELTIRRDFDIKVIYDKVDEFINDFKQI